MFVCMSMLLFFSVISGIELKAAARSLVMLCVGSSLSLEVAISSRLLLYSSMAVLTASATFGNGSPACAAQKPSPSSTSYDFGFGGAELSLELSTGTVRRFSRMPRMSCAIAWYVQVWFSMVTRSMSRSRMQSRGRPLGSDEAGPEDALEKSSAPAAPLPRSSRIRSSRRRPTISATSLGGHLMMGSALAVIRTDRRPSTMRSMYCWIMWSAMEGLWIVSYAEGKLSEKSDGDRETKDM
mmetsp:Transcript_18873/g.51291  ORF Transcript_18873/g.51291 Transcript_18873/m.51291 type:complete len:239 (-) Transcript_18873:341-1057(-)